MKNISIEQLAKHENSYIAVTEDNTKILAAAKSIKELESRLQDLQIKNAVIRYIGPLNKFLAPLCR